MNISRLCSNLLVLNPSGISQVKYDIDEELSFHIEMIQQEYQTEGYSEEAARELAISRFGDQQKISKACLKEKLSLPLSIKIFVTSMLSLILFFSATEIFNQTKWKKVSPFEAVQIIGDSAKVNVDDEWYELRSINQYSTDEILAHSKNKYQSMWKKRFIEDIYEVLEGLDNLSGLNVEVELVNADGIVINQHITMTKYKRLMARLYAKEQQATTSEDLEYFKVLRSKLKKVMIGGQSNA